VLALQLDALSVPVEVLTTPEQTLMVTVTEPVPGEATATALPAAVVHAGVVVAVGDGVADRVGDVVAVGDVLAVRDAVADGATVGEAPVRLAEADGCGDVLPTELPLGCTQWSPRRWRWRTVPLALVDTHDAEVDAASIS
jgi:hypothetical protein